MRRDLYLGAGAIFAGAAVSVLAGGVIGMVAAASCAVGLGLILHTLRAGPV